MFSNINMDLLIPAVGGTSCAAFAGVFAYTKLRPFFPVKVNCWFCNTDSKVSFKRKNSFVCSNCNQYNGFNENGDYNCDIPSQYCESMNSPPSQYHKKLLSTNPPSEQDTSVTNGLSLGNGLCQTCNIYQAMKVQALADFEPTDPDKFDEEVEIYEQRLEKLYGGLCRVCNQTLKCTLGEQDSWLKPKLLHWRLKQSSIIKNFLTPLHCHSTPISSRVSIFLRLICILGLIFSTVINSLVHFSSFHLINNSSGLDSLTTFISDSSDILCEYERGIVVAFLVIVLSSVVIAGRSLIRLWDGISCLALVALLSLTSLFLSSHLSTLTILAAKLSISLLSLVSLCLSLRSPLSNSSQRRISTSPVKKFLSNDLSQLTEASEDSPCVSPNGRPFSPQVSNIASSVASRQTNSLRNFPSNPNVNGYINNNPNVTEQTSPTNFRLRQSVLNSQKENLDNSFGGLNIGTANKTHQPLLSARSAFMTKTSPPRGSVGGLAQSSWVAGGYWGSPTKGIRQPSVSQRTEDALPPSRASSQSSGFVSLNTNYDNLFERNGSQQGSLRGDPLEANSLSSDPQATGFFWNFESASQSSQDGVRSRLANGYSTPSVRRFDSQSLSPSETHEQLSRTLSRLSQHEVSTTPSAGGRSSWIAFILGMSVMANAFLVLILSKNETLMQIIS